MKSKFFRVVSIILIVIGIIGAGVVVDDLVKGVKEDTVLGSMISICFVLAGILILRGLKAGYTPGWRLLIGGFMIFFAVTGLGVELDSLINHNPENLAVGLVMVAIFSVSGLLLARSGYRRRDGVSRNSFEKELRASSSARFGQPGTVEALDSEETILAGTLPREHR